MKGEFSIKSHVDLAPTLRLLFNDNAYITEFSRVIVPIWTGRSSSLENNIISVKNTALPPKNSRK